MAWYETVDLGAWLELLRTLALVGLVVFLLRVRPWRWVLPFLRSGRRG